MEKSEIIKEIKKGSIFVYPTDTVYGLGCNAYNENSVGKILKIKKSKQPLSVITPSKKWISNNCIVSKEIIDKYFPGPFTLILKKRKECKVPLIVSNGKNILGVRIPKHEFTEIIKEADIPFITTSANLHGNGTPKSFEEIPKEILNKADFIIKNGKMSGKPSRIIDLTFNKIKIIRE